MMHAHNKLSMWKRSMAAALLVWGTGWGLAQAATSQVHQIPKAAAPAQACPPTQAQPSAPELAQLQRQARDRGMLWKLEHDGRTSWLYGTIHVNKREWVMPGPRTLQALMGADRLALELNLLDPAVLQALTEGLRARDGAPPLPPALQQRLDRQLQAACMPEALAPLRPEAQLVTLMTLIGRHQGLDPQLGVDLVLAGAAHARGKPVIGLETPDTQLRELVSDDPVVVQRSVDTGLRQLERGDAAQQLARLAQAWADGDVRQLERYPQWCHCLNTADERADYARLIDGRNPGMAAAIAQQLRAGHTLFVAVGAMHMIGPQGLPALLAAQGFQVQPVALGGKAPAAARAAEAKKPPAQ
ncbi:MAG: TraB/GumN family protein [Comamonas sp.]